jgi:glycosyltransferase involved in cell wall biosynthesis
MADTNLEILILLLYYNRPNMLHNALDSIRRLNYDNWRLAFIDDSSPTPGKPIVKKMLSEYSDRIDFYHTHCTNQEKIAQGGSLIGLVMNNILKESSSDIAIMLCDDDALHHDYFDNLNKWFIKHPEMAYCYSHVIQYNPFKERPLNYMFRDTDIVRFSDKAEPRYAHRFNLTGDIIPSGRVDASQVAWRLKCNQEGEVWMPYPLTANLDSAFYRDLFNAYGSCPFSGFYAQYKGVYDDPLLERQRRGAHYKTTDLPSQPVHCFFPWRVF